MFRSISYLLQFLLSEIYSLFQECKNPLLKYWFARNRLVTEEAKTNIRWKNQPSQMNFMAGN